MKNIPLVPNLKLFYDFGIFFTFLNLFLFKSKINFILILALWDLGAEIKEEAHGRTV